jgi:hypothetical protein
MLRSEFNRLVKDLNGFEKEAFVKAAKNSSLRT